MSSHDANLTVSMGILLHNNYFIEIFLKEHTHQVTVTNSVSPCQKLHKLLNVYTITSKFIHRMQKPMEGEVLCRITDMFSFHQFSLSFIFMFSKS